MAIGCTAAVEEQDAPSTDIGRAETSSVEDVSLELPHLLLHREGRLPVPIRPNTPTVKAAVRGVYQFWCDGPGKDQESVELLGRTTTKPPNLTCDAVHVEVVKGILGDDRVDEYDWINFEAIADFVDGRWDVQERRWRGYSDEMYDRHDNYVAHLVVRFH